MDKILRELYGNKLIVLVGALMIGQNSFEKMGNKRGGLYNRLDDTYTIKTCGLNL